MRCPSLFLLSALLFLAPAPANAAGARSVPVDIILNSSTAPKEDNPFLACAGQRFSARDAEVHNRTVANYLSRFYGHTDAFHKARRCDSFLLRRQEPAPDSDHAYHVAVFSYDDATQVERVRRLEPGGIRNLRTPATSTAPGLLTFKGPPERYRVFFLGKRIVFFFWAPPVVGPSHGEDPELQAAALEFLEDCLR